ncbi:MAG: murein L,D-transpeptidase [Desulfobulbaceae bacterium]|nr:murein L,D-transpeptidase [Desulfobulbaceae bacterium]
MRAKKISRTWSALMRILPLLITFLFLTRLPAAAEPLLELKVLQVQVMLDRAGFSSGTIDGHPGANTEKALAIYEKQGPGATATVAVKHYRITAADAAGPFVTIPAGMMQKATLATLGYTSLLEALAERFHTTPTLLQQLNPAAAFRAQEEIVVPNVEAMVLPSLPALSPAPLPPAPDAAATTPAREAVPTAKPEVVVKVMKRLSALTVTDSGGRVVLYAPVTTGSKHDPLPLGEWQVNGVQYNPVFMYNPSLFWNAARNDSKATLPAGPNNPVVILGT